MKKYAPFIIIFLISVVAFALTTWKGLAAKNQIVRKLPIYGTKTAVGKDTIYQAIKPFSFINQLNNTITEKDLDNKNYLVAYFFTGCKSVAPVLNTNMAKIAKALTNDTTFKILSHTLKPEMDSARVLKAYARDNNIDSKNWWLLTGNKKDLYNMAGQSYLLQTEEDHSSKQLALVDKNKHVRGFYNGTDSAEVKRLIADIVLLKHEQKMADLKNFVKSMEITTKANRK